MMNPPATNAAPELPRFSHVDTAADPRALDVGCGLGFDVTEMARRMPPGGKATGIDVSQAMIGQARRRASGLGLDVGFEIGDAAGLPFGDGSFDACRAERVLLHVPGPEQVVAEMTRVTRPGGRVAALEPDLGTVVVDHPDQDTTRVILRSFASTMAQGWIGRQQPRLFRQARLVEVSVTATMVLMHLDFFKMMFGDHVSRLCADGTLSSRQADHWWSELARQSGNAGFLAGGVFFLTAATRL